ncbi:hypothetical protein C8034_v006287 [Colletotrichum sidae]|uniref:Uncharacterized protein n=1 Tax=Colletotrichum sidae TaxID=1347389 RepID=A0A4R8TU61_9PEZI|nr:hypothetical protein C8034_v006287 [Colletotrichum sidae]
MATDRPLDIVVSSKNPVKINATKAGFELASIGPGLYEFKGVSVPSGVPELRAAHVRPRNPARRREQSPQRAAARDGRGLLGRHRGRRRGAGTPAGRPDELCLGRRCRPRGEGRQGEDGGVLSPRRVCQTRPAGHGAGTRGRLGFWRGEFEADQGLGRAVDGGSD